MADHITEEEQLEAIKRWWAKYGTLTLVVVILALGGYTGWNFYQAQQEAKVRKASDRYQGLVNVINVDQGQNLTKEKKQNAIDLATAIVTDYPNGLYADLSNMILARFSVEDNDLNAAESYLRQVLDNDTNEATALLAKSRLARVLASSQRFDEALELLDKPSDDAYDAIFSEIRGDIYAAQGKSALAEQAFQKALSKLDIQQFSRRSIIQFKLDDVKVADASASNSTSSSSDEPEDGEVASEGEG